MSNEMASQILSGSESEQSAPVTQPNATSEQPRTEMNDFESRLAVLTKMERKLKEQESTYKSRMKDDEERSTKLKEYDEFFKLFDENPIEAIKKKKGWGLQEINEFAVKNSSDEDLDPIAKITKGYESKIAELEEKLNKSFEEKIKQKEEELNQKSREGQIKEFKHGIKSFLLENKDTFEFVNAEEGGSDLVYDVIYEDIMRQKEKGVPDEGLQVMDVKRAAELVETHLDKTYSKYLSLNKVKSKIVPSEEKDIFARLMAKSEPQTLNSSFTPKSQPVGQLSEQERRQQAIDFIKSQKT